MAFKPKHNYTDEDRDKVMFEFKNSSNNTVPAIMKRTGYSENFISNTIDKNLKFRN